MNVKEAKRITEKSYEWGMDIDEQKDYAIAHGFLGAWHQQEKRAEVLVKALRAITSVADSFGPDNPMAQSTYICAATAKQALQAYEKEDGHDER